jgi:hypothetical protein
LLEQDLLRLRGSETVELEDWAEIEVIQEEIVDLILPITEADS